MISVQNLVKDYGTVKALKGTSFEVKPGEIVGLLGPNGAGKTTAMQIITGYLKPTTGRVLINDHDVQIEREITQSMIGYLPENTPLYQDLSVYEYLDFIAGAHGLTGDDKKKAIKNVIKTCGLTERPFFEITELSKGFKQRVGLAQALLHDPEILILDEPTTGLDPNQILEIRELITNLGQKKTIILSTHIMQEVEAVCNRVIMIKEGEIVADDSVKGLKAEKVTGHQTSVTVKGPADKVRVLFEAIDGILQINSKPGGEANVVTFIISSETDIRSQINKIIFQAGYEVLELTASEKSMEDIFHKLTK
jgi:ABC-2 type transport system ATP-binding protein